MGWDAGRGCKVMSGDRDQPGEGGMAGATKTEQKNRQSNSWWHPEANSPPGLCCAGVGRAQGAEPGVCLALLTAAHGTGICPCALQDPEAPVLGGSC